MPQYWDSRFSEKVFGAPAGFELRTSRSRPNRANHWTTTTKARISHLVRVSDAVNHRQEQEDEELDVGEDVQDEPVEGAVQHPEQAGQVPGSEKDTLGKNRYQVRF